MTYMEKDMTANQVLQILQVLQEIQAKIMNSILLVSTTLTSIEKNTVITLKNYVKWSITNGSKKI